MVKIIHIQTVTCISSITEADFRILQAYKKLSYAKHGDNYCLVSFLGILFCLVGWFGFEMFMVVCLFLIQVKCYVECQSSTKTPSAQSRSESNTQAQADLESPNSQIHSQ